MTEKSATALVAVTSAVLIGLALVTAPGGQKFKRAYAAAWLAVGLSFAADLAPELVGPFAAAVLLGAVVANPGVFGKITGGTGSTTTTPTGGNAYGPSAPRSNLPG